MLTIKLRNSEIDEEKQRICEFLNAQIAPDEKVVVGVSGGVDSDLVARLAVHALGKERVKLFTVLQEGLDPRHVVNAQELARDLVLSLTEIDLAAMPFSIIRALSAADPGECFRPDGLIDPARAKCSVRSVVLSTYLDRGYLTLGGSNRTEWETGFFMPFGDGLGHVKPIVHLYKSQVYQLAEAVGTRRNVIDQPASSGFWIGAEDLEDLAFWLYNNAPIAQQIDFDANAVAEAFRIRSHLTTERVDMALLGITRGLEDDSIAEASLLPCDIVARLRKLVAAAQKLKRRTTGIRLENYSH